MFSVVDVGPSDLSVVMTKVSSFLPSFVAFLLIYGGFFLDKSCSATRRPVTVV